MKRGLLGWFTARERKVPGRLPLSGVVAYYWEGKVPTAHPVEDISESGAYVSTEERWHVETLLMITLQRGEEISNPADCITLPCRVIRHGEDGIGVRFMPTSKQERERLRRFVRLVTGGGDLRRSAGSNGEAIVECALVVPLLFLLIINAFNFGAFIYCWLTVADAARAAADYASLNSSTANSPAPPTLTQLTTVVQNATSGLPNYTSSNPAVTACEYNNGTTTSFLSTSACPTGVTAPPADPEAIATGSATAYSTVAVDVTYTFTPLLAGSTFMRFGLPSLPGTIHRRSVVRWP